MENKKPKIEDYIYLRVTKDFYHDEDEDIIYKAGDVFRYKKDKLAKAIVSREFSSHLVENNWYYDQGISLVSNEASSEDEYLYEKLYKKIYFEEGGRIHKTFYSGAVLCINEWFKSKVSKEDLENILRHSKRTENDPNLVTLSDYVSFDLNFEKGEELDLENQSTRLLFYDREFWLNAFDNCEVITGAEKEEMFKEDFSGSIYVGSHYFSESDFIEEHHFFMINEDINIKQPEILFSNIKGLGFLRRNYDMYFDKDGYIRYIDIKEDANGLTVMKFEKELLKFSKRMTPEDAMNRHNERVEAEKMRAKKAAEAAKAEREAKEKYLARQYRKNANNIELFPGSGGNFAHIGANGVKTEYSLETIKNFYRNLKNINSEVLKNVIIYGGTLPYVLTDASESRSFGDVDMFVPMKDIESFRAELATQPDFEMIFDSKQLTRLCKLTSRVKDEITGVDKYKTQDFGFKAKLFGVDISVYPIYEYKDSIMSKSFNRKPDCSFLLGVKVLNNAKIEDMVKQVELYDSSFKIVPIEYTIVSKESANAKNYKNREERDSADLEYINANRDKLEISDEKLESIRQGYPDFGISVAYMVDEDADYKGRFVRTLTGGQYRRLVLSKPDDRRLS